MVKLTVFFKDKIIHSELFESGTIHIGRDESNDLVIDSLAVAPTHAAIIIHSDSCSIKQLNDNFDMVINGKKAKESTLNNNDTLFIGKHDIVFNTTSEFFDKPHLAPQAAKPSNEETNLDLQLPTANLQFINGKNIGKIVPLKKALTRLELGNGGIVMIARRSDGYFVSALEDHGTTAVNNKPVQDHSCKLTNNDILTIENSALQFFVNHHA